VIKAYMLDTQESIDFFKNLKRSLSTGRFVGYQERGNELDAFAKYLWNMLLCESLYPCFQILEVAFRNTVHSEISVAIKDPTWILNEHKIFYNEEQEAVKKVKENLKLVGSPMTEDCLIAEMKFGFWTSLLNSHYDKLWHRIIAGVFPHMPKTMRTRGDASTLMNGVRKLRNAALHHHSIWHWSDLKDRHAQMRNLIGYICKSSAAMLLNLIDFQRFTQTEILNAKKWCQKSCLKFKMLIQINFLKSAQFA
jgi:hypothetical protein